jgi:hypothetical protein
MSDFTLYLQIGLEHILDTKGYDHILFVIALCAIYTLKDWKKLLWLITAFTIGHSITLALATFKVVAINANIIEFLIPVTIIFTCITNFFYQPTENQYFSKQSFSKHSFGEQGKNIFRYLITLVFGLIHGLGFSNFLISLLGKQANIGLPLLAFNIGLEIGQLVIVAILLIFISLLSLFLAKQREWVLVISAIVLGISLTLVMDKWIF